MAATVTAAPAIPRTATRRTSFMALGGLMAVIALVGFWPRYFGPLATGTLSQPLLIHIHASVFTGWLALFLLQAAFAATHRVQWHMKIGKLGIWYGLLLIVVGLTTGVVRAAVHETEAEALLYVALADMIMFGGFFGAAIVYRRKPQLHRRLMVVAATSLLVAAVGRMAFLPPPPSGIPIGVLVWSAPVLVAMLVEFRRTRTVHSIYVAGIAVFLVRAYSVPLSQTAAWTSFASAVFGMVR